VALPQAPVLVAAAPPPVVFAPSGYVLGIAPPVLAFAVIGPQFWSGLYLTGGVGFGRFWGVYRPDLVVPATYYRGSAGIVRRPGFGYPLGIGRRAYVRPRVFARHRGF